MKIILGTDGSDFSNAAIGFCRNIIVDQKSTSLKIILAVERTMPLASEPFGVSIQYYNEIEQSLRRQGEKFVEQAETMVRALFPDGLKELTVEVVTGSPQRIIVETAREWNADLIVVGSHGYGFWSRAMLGSVSSGIVHHAPCSVLVVRTDKENITFDS